MTDPYCQFSVNQFSAICLAAIHSLPCLLPKARLSKTRNAETASDCRLLIGPELLQGQAFGGALIEETQSSLQRQLEAFPTLRSSDCDQHSADVTDAYRRMPCGIKNVINSRSLPSKVLMIQGFVTKI